MDHKPGKPKKTGISTFIATLLLMVLAVAAGIVIYAYSMGYLGSYSSQIDQSNLQIQSVAQYNHELHIYVKNTGKSIVKIDDTTKVYIDGLAIKSPIQVYATPIEIPEGVTSGIMITGLDETYVGKTATIKIVTVSGTFVQTQIKITQDGASAPPGSVNGIKFDDRDGDGVKDAEDTGLSGGIIKLIQGTTEIASATTSTDGSYSFSDVVPGSYTLEDLTSQTGWIQTYPTPGSYSLNIVSGMVETGKDFGNFKLVSISGMRFNDLNDNGVKDTGEPSLQGWAIERYKDGTLVDSRVTDENGAYSFTGVAVGTYIILDVPLTEWTQTMPTPIPPGTYSITTKSGTNAVDKDFGYYKP